jgi:putative hydrolase of the HAD superfamily
MNHNPPTDIFFDLDHTLWDFDRNSRSAFERVFRKHRLELELDLFLKQYEPINHRYWKLYREDIVSKEELRRGRLIEAFDYFGMQFSLEEIDALAHSYILELPGDNHLFEGAIEILDYLQHRYKLHIITNGFKEVQYLKLKNSRIDKFFKTVTTSEEVGVKKPHPQIFQEALSRAAVSSDKTLMVGDSLEADVEGANKAGMKTMFFNHRNEQVGPSDIVIKQLQDIKSYL